MQARWNVIFSCLVGLWTGCLSPRPTDNNSGSAAHTDAASREPLCESTAPVHFIVLTNFEGFRRSSAESPGTETLLSEEISLPLSWDELVLSWNANAPAGTHFKFEARAIYPDHRTAFYTLGLWSENGQPRESVNGQKDQDGDVKTDTLVLQRPARAVQVRIRCFSGEAGVQPLLKFLGLSFLNSSVDWCDTTTDRVAWGKSLAVPERSQIAYPGGRGWCSPTSVSMVLAYWAKALGRAELDIDVPEVAKAVTDPNWPGTGNWPFNTAFAGHFPGMRACVTRLRGVSQLEQWINAGVPVILSVSSRLLHGKDEAEEGGHLVACAGFTSEGNPIVNDPWAHLDRGERVQRVFPRANLVKAWRHSRNTVYLIYPESTPAPGW